MQPSITCCKRERGSRNREFYCACKQRTIVIENPKQLFVGSLAFQSEFLNEIWIVVLVCFLCFHAKETAVNQNDSPSVAQFV